MHVVCKSVDSDEEDAMFPLQWEMDESIKHYIHKDRSALHLDL
jgi:hypothetical protein